MATWPLEVMKPCRHVVGLISTKANDVATQRERLVSITRSG